MLPFPRLSPLLFPHHLNASVSISLSIISRRSFPLFLTYLIVCLLFRRRPTPFLFWFCFVRRKWLITAPIFFLHRAHFCLYIPTVIGISVHFYVGMVSLHFKLLYAVSSTICTALIYFILSACFSSFLLCSSFTVYIFILHHGSRQETCLHQS